MDCKPSQEDVDIVSPVKTELIDQEFSEDDFDARQAVRGLRFEAFENRLSSKNYG